jgi:putative ubiquitin-RnfH superfamily antitoxin RatB of RatAB toxin-antitoxin module
MAEPQIQITLCWSLEPRQVSEHSMHVPVGSTVESVVDDLIATVSTDNAEIPHSGHWGQLKFQQPGIWGRKVSWSSPVHDGDRVELYRALKVDPKVARRQRFKRQGKGRTGLFANRKSGVAAGY